MTKPGGSLSDRLAVVKEMIDSSAPEPDKVTLVAVSKKFPAAVIAEALTLGLEDFGENYAQELIAKANEFPAKSAETETPLRSMPDLRWHFIGGLQRNKVKKLAPYVELWQTVDRSELIQEIARRSPGARILLQVNTTGEAQKSGCQPSALPALVEEGRDANLAVAGLMTLGPSDRSSPQQAFESLRQLSRECEVKELSMGMSADLEIALAAGATIVRVGSALFGPRSSL